MGVTDLGRALGLPKSSAHRLLAALAKRGLVDRDDRDRYRPGIALLALGLGVLDSEPIVAAARQVLEAGARDLGETHFLVGARGGRLLVLDKAEGSGFLRASPQVGSSVPVHATAVGGSFSSPLRPRTSSRSTARRSRDRPWSIHSTSSGRSSGLA